MLSSLISVENRKPRRTKTAWLTTQKGTLAEDFAMLRSRSTVRKSNLKGCLKIVHRQVA